MQCPIALHTWNLKPICLCSLKKDHDAWYYEAAYLTLSWELWGLNVPETPSSPHKCVHPFYTFCWNQIKMDNQHRRIRKLLSFCKQADSVTQHVHEKRFQFVQQFMGGFVCTKALGLWCGDTSWHILFRSSAWSNRNIFFFNFYVFTLYRGFQ